jgi:hypothetical protein
MALGAALPVTPTRDWVDACGGMLQSAFMDLLLQLRVWASAWASRVTNTRRSGNSDRKPSPGPGDDLGGGVPLGRRSPQPAGAWGASGA